MDQYIELMKDCAIFSGLPDAVLEKEILPLGRIQENAKGSYLIRFQDACSYFGIILTGKVSMMHIYGNGNYGIIGVLEERDLFGADIACTRSGSSPYYAVAMQYTKVLLFPVSMVWEPGVLTDPTRNRILQNLLLFIADENMRKEYRIAILLQKGLRDRIVTFLLMQAKKRGANTFTIPFTRGELASYLCVNRSCLSHELSVMQQEGLIQFSRNTFTVFNMMEDDGEY